MDRSRKFFGDQWRSRGRDEPFGTTYRLAAVLLAALGVAALASAVVDRQPMTDPGGTLGQAAIAVTAMAGLVELARWRAARAPSALWLTGALMLIAASMQLRRTAGALEAAWASTAAGNIAAAFVVCAAGAGVLAVWRPYGVGDLRVAVRYSFFALPAAVVACTIMGLHLTGGLEPFSPVVGGVIMTSLWTVLGIAWTWRARSADGWALGWLGLFAFSLATCELTVAVDRVEQRPVGVLSVCVVAVGSLLAARGAQRELDATFAAQAAAIESSEERVARETDRSRELQDMVRDWAHASRNALGAISASVETLERYHDVLPPDTRAQLAKGVTHEIARLHEIIHAETWRDRQHVTNGQHV